MQSVDEPHNDLLGIKGPKDLITDEQRRTRSFSVASEDEDQYMENEARIRQGKSTMEQNYLGAGVDDRGAITNYQGQSD